MKIATNFRKNLLVATLGKYERITKNELAQDYMANYRIGLIIFLIGVLFCGILIDNVRDKIMIILFFPFILVLRGHLKIEQIVARRELNFKVIAYGDILSGICSLLVGSIVAYYYPLLGLLIYQISLPLINLIYLIAQQGSVLFNIYLNRNISINLSAEAKILDERFTHDSKMQLYTGISIFAFRNLDNFLVGIFFGPAKLGLYDKSYKAIMMPIRLIPGVLNGVLLPSFDSNDAKSLQRSYYRILKVLAPTGVIVSILLFEFSRVIVSILLGDSWKESIIYVRIFAVSMPLQMINIVAAPFFQARSKVALLFRLSVVNAILVISTLIISAALFDSILDTIIAVQFVFMIMPFMYYYVLNKYVFERKRIIEYHHIFLCFLSSIVMLCIYLEMIKFSAINNILLLYSAVLLITNKDIRRFL